MNRLAVSRFVAFEVGPDNVFSFPDGQALFKLTVMVGVDFPTNLLRLIGGFADLDRDAVDGQIVRSPNRTDDQRVGLSLGPLSREQRVGRVERRQEKQNAKGPQNG